LIVGSGFLNAASSYADAEPAKEWISYYGWVSIGLAVVFYGLLWIRRRWLGSATSARLRTLGDLPRATWFGVAILVLMSLGLFVGATLAPVAMTRHVGTASVILFSAASWCIFGGMLVFIGARWELPVAKGLVMLAILSSCWNDNHAVRETKASGGARPDTLAAFGKWYEHVEGKYPDAKMHPCFIVAAEGGGVRAAYWTAAVLSTLQDRNPQFASHLFAISGVSGGSLGAAVFTALLGESDTRPMSGKARAILGQDFLSPAIVAMLYPDFIQRFIPVPIPLLDRSRALERGWEEAWRQETGNSRFSEPLMSLWDEASDVWTPSLFLNPTSVEKGNRVIASNIRITSAFLDSDDLAEKLRRPGQERSQALPNVALSTAAHMSARFTFVSPAGLLPDASHVVDGGYFENAGATTAEEIVTRIRAYCHVKNITDVDLKIIMIGNNPRKMPVAPAAPQTQVGSGRTKSALRHGRLMGELMSPLWAILNTREAHGTYAQQSLHRQQRRWKADASSDADLSSGEGDVLSTGAGKPSTSDIVYFRLADRKVPLPLGWMLSAAAAREIDAQIVLNQWPVLNGDAVKSVMDALPSL
jgi:hypothetical protein